MTFEQILRSHQQVNSLARTLIDRPAFEEMHVTLPNPCRPESGFIRATSWLYCLYFEAGRVSLTFLRSLGEAYAVLDRTAIDQHMEVVRCLRTELNHNLGFEDSDQAARTSAAAWRRKACGTAIPDDDEQWRKCYDSLVAEASAFLGNIEEVMRRVEADGERSKMHIEEWRCRLERSWPSVAFDRLVNDAKYRLGRDGLNSVAFRNRHLDRWRKQLELLEDDFNFEYEVTRLIEKTLLDEDTIVLPVTGRDIMDDLGLTPGPLVGRYLDEARKLLESGPRTRDEILTHLRNWSPQR